MLVLFLILNTIYNRLFLLSQRLTAHGSPAKRGISYLYLIVNNVFKRLTVCRSELQANSEHKIKSSAKKLQAAACPVELAKQRPGILRPRRLYILLILLFLPCTLYLVPCTSVADAATVTLAWDQNPESDITGYKIHYGNASGNYAYSVDVGNYSSCTISGLAEGTTYYFAATAYNAGNIDSGFSTELAYTIPAATSLPPAVDTDGDGILDDDELDVYGTDPDRADTDGDGINDGEELEYWGDSWRLDYDGDGKINLLDLDSDNDSVSDGQEVSMGFDPSNPDSKPFIPDSKPQSSILLEIGEARIDHNWTRIDFHKSFTDPIVVANPLSTNDRDPAVVRIRNVNSSGFEIRIQEWDYLDDRHSVETIGYLVMEGGSSIIAGGTRLEAGKFETSKTGSFGRINFNQAFQTVPVVITSIASFNESDAVTGRLNNIDVQGFDFCMQEQESNSQIHTSETVFYLAWEPSAGTIDGITYGISKTANSVRNNFYTIQFKQNFANQPILMADMQTANSMDTANIRWRNKDINTVEVQIDEEQSRNRETNHTSETVGYMVLSY